jgi:endogenous inhibitor of DNA gyrase (YacG/DUF329 family)
MLCPLCGKPAIWEDNPSRPFCSERCKMIDLGNWVDEEYKMPASINPLEDYADVESPSEQSSTSHDLSDD